MNIWWSLNGMVTVDLVSGDAAGALVAVSNAGIFVENSEILDDALTVRFVIRRQNLKRLQKLAAGKGYTLKVSGRGGIYWTLMCLRKRPVLLIGLSVLVFLSLFLPSRVLFVKVEGNENVPTKLILEKCNEVGIGFGASRRHVRSEKVKNALLEQIGQLQWIGVNTAGCTATVTVRERSLSENSTEKNGVSHIIAKRDGIILDCTATAGTLHCKTGQVVRAGDLLISGYTDCGIVIQAGRAQGEILAQTRRNLQTVTPAQRQLEVQTQQIQKKYAIIIGKKRINFYKGSGISGTTCDKIYKENYISLPGGFVLPVAVVTELWTTGTYAAAEMDEENAGTLLQTFAAWYLPTQMTGGSIISKWETVSLDGGIYLQQGDYACSEQIGQERDEEIIIPYGNDN